MASRKKFFKGLGRPSFGMTPIQARHGHEDSLMSSRTRMRTFKIHEDEDEDKDEDKLLKYHNYLSRKCVFSVFY